MTTVDPIARSAAMQGPVSAALEADLRNWVRRHGIVVWLDADEDAGRSDEAPSGHPSFEETDA